MKGNDKIMNIDNKNIYTLKTNPVKGPNGEIIEPAKYLDAEPATNTLGGEAELTKEQLEKIKEALVAEIDKTTTFDSYRDLTFGKLYHAFTNSSRTVADQIKEEFKRRILSGEMKITADIGESHEQAVSRFFAEIENERRRLLAMKSYAEKTGDFRRM